VSLVVAAGIWILAVVPLGTAYLQAATDLRTYAADPACTLGISAPPSDSGGCGVGTVTVGAARPTARGGDLSLKFADGARREVRVSPKAFALFRAPGTLAFVQMRRSRITLIGDERYVDVTDDNPVRRIAGARTAALVALCGGLAMSAVALVAVRRDALVRRANESV
jgi:hypothetical protein